MEINNEIHRRHKAHRNILYALVLILLILQIATFVSLSSQVTKVNSELDKTKVESQKALEKAINESNTIYNKLLGDYNAQNQQNFNEITRTISTQQVNFDQQIKLLKTTSQGDFSSVIENAVKGVVSVGTDRSAGTGFIIAKEGYIITNQHVIDGANKIAILTYDKKVVPVSLVLEDKKRDIALLKAEGNYNAVELANSDDLQVGRKVIAIGNPLGLSFSVTEGIISALHRKGPNGLEEYIQTDVSLNPGNSGGPLIDTSGKVIGVNNFKVGNADNLGFALESNIVKKSIESVIKL